MPVITPLLYDALANEQQDPERYPPLLPEPLESAFGNAPPDQILDARAVLDDRPGLTTFLRPIPFRDAVRSGAIGVPILGIEEVQGLAPWADERLAISPARLGQRWWEFWPTVDGWWVLFPGDAMPAAQVAVALLVPTPTGAQLRLMELAFATDLSDSAGVQPSIPPMPCVPHFKEQQPGRSYVGVCRSNGCPAGCKEDLRLVPSHGRLLFEGCICPDARTVSSPRAQARKVSRSKATDRRRDARIPTWDNVGEEAVPLVDAEAS